MDDKYSIICDQLDKEIHGRLISGYETELQTEKNGLQFSFYISRQYDAIHTNFGKRGLECGIINKIL